MGEEQMFTTEVVAIATAVVTYPEGTTFDADGMPIPPED